MDKAQHPYTRGLLDCLPQIGGSHTELPVLRRQPEWFDQQEPAR